MIYDEFLFDSIRNDIINKKIMERKKVETHLKAGINMWDISKNISRNISRNILKNTPKNLSYNKCKNTLKNKYIGGKMRK